MADHNQLGEKGEELAVKFLVNLGYQIIDTNWREQKFEIDIIALDEEEIVFVEVKTRSTSAYGNPEEAVTETKQKHLINGADFYIQENEVDLDARFDVIAIIENSNELTINHIKSAFSAF